MRTLSLSAVLLSLLLPALSCAQSTPRLWPTGIIEINRDWLVKAGDHPPFTQPNTPGGTQVTFSENFVLEGPDTAGNVRWISRPINLPPNPGPIDLLLIADSGSFDVYVDGRQVGPAAQPSWTWRRANELIYPLRTAANPSQSQVQVAIRSRLRLITFTRRLTPRRAVIGDPASIQALAAAHLGNRLGTAAFSVSVNCVGIVFAALLVALFLRQRIHREYLWLGLTVLLGSICQALNTSAIEGFAPLFFDCFLGHPAQFFFMAAELSFVYAFIGSPPSRFVRLYQLLLILAPLVCGPAAWLVSGLIGVDLWVQNVLILPGAVLVLVVLALWWRRGSREAGLLILPIALTNAAAIARNVEFLIRFAHPGFAFPFVQMGIVRLDYVSLAQISFLLAISFVIIHRFLQVSRDQAQAQSELASARTIQQFLVPQDFQAIPGLRIESIYRPAQQVGGDFFQVIALPQGGALAVMGDVSGKGLPAAMNVAMIVGALRTLAELTHSPAAILQGLNRHLHGRSGGFTTCVALHLSPAGFVTLANAGHINPYLAGREVLTDASLPLGLDLDLDLTYPETTLQLAAGDTLTLMTDGVVEARDPRTGDLFGFDRTRAISQLPAQQIAEAAQTFGQEDDIAVLTLTLV